MIKIIKKIFSIYEYVSLMGVLWFLFRLKYEFLKKINYFDRVNSKILKKVELTSSDIYKYQKINLVNKDYKSDDSFKEKADYAFNGKIFSFSNEYLDYNYENSFNWHINPLSKIKANINLSWNKLSDFGEYGDIKLIWEASRFPQIYYFINAYSIYNEEKYAKECISQIINWIDYNPSPKGVNYKCGQEISFRLFSWLVALDYFYDFFTKDEKTKIVRNIYISLLRIESNIDYAAKSVKNNHSISEAAGLFIGGLLFPQFDDSKRFLKKGIKYLLTETDYQVYNDGTYIQHSFTYQRLALDVLSYVMLITDKKSFRLPIELKLRHNKMIVFLNSFIQENGWLPNYGSNDGANLFPLSGDDYRDFRSSLNFATAVNTNSMIFNNHDKLIEFFNIDILEMKRIEQNDKYETGGYYILRNKDIFSFIRCHTYKDRPSQNDMFHLDIWYKCKNIFCDTGSYSYNTDKSFKNNFIGVIGHNTVMINDSNQMEQVLNFGYSNWTKAKCLFFDNNHFKAENYAYTKEFGIVQERDINLENDKLIITDKIKNIKQKTNIKQIWNTKYKVVKINETTLKVENCIIKSNVKYKIEDSFISDYYNSYVVGNRIIFELNTNKDFEIKTTIQFKD